MPTYGSKQVYVIQHELGPVKIGIADYPEHRISDLQVSSPYELKLRQTERPGDAKHVEEYLHQKFRKYHIRGEWFDLPPDQRDFTIPTHIDENGNPNKQITISHGRQMDAEWAEVFERLYQAMQRTKYRTDAIDSIRSQWQELRDDDEDIPEADEFPNSKPHIDEIREDTPDHMKRCSRCGHEFGRSESSCPICGGGSFMEGNGGRY